MERELELPGPDGRVPGMWINAVWDESGAFVLYPTLLGIKGADCRFFFRGGVSSFCVNSGEHRHEPRGEAARERRDGAVARADALPRCPCEKGVLFGGGCCVGEPAVGRESGEGPDVGVFWLQTPTVLHVHEDRARVRDLLPRHGCATDSL